MTALLITLTSVAGYLTGWFLTARYRVTLWHKRGVPLFKHSREFSTRSFDNPHDRPWIAFFALVITFVWPLMLIIIFMAHHLFAGIDKAAERERVANEKRRDDVQLWQTLLASDTASEMEKTVAREVLRGLGVKM